MNIERYRMVMHRIWADLRTWNQINWHSSGDVNGVREGYAGRHVCRTAHCAAGWAQVLAGRPGYTGYTSLFADRLGDCTFTITTFTIAQTWLELSEKEADYLFDSGRTLVELNAVLKRGRVFA